MNGLKKVKMNKILAGTLAFLVLTIIASPALLADGDCEEALVKCSIDAALAGFLGGIHSWIFYSTICFLGYTWCLEYYLKN